MKKNNKRNQKNEERAEELKGIDLEIYEAELAEKEASEIYKKYPNREAFKEVSKTMAEVKRLKEQKAKEEGRWNPTTYMPWRTEVKSRLHISLVKRVAERMKMEILSEGCGKITIKGKKESQICAELQTMGLVPDEDYEIRTRQMSLEAAREYYKKENERLLEEENKRKRVGSSGNMTVRERDRKFFGVFEYQGLYGEQNELAVQI